MSCLDCKRFFPDTCKADCCGPVPIDIDFFRASKKFMQRKYIDVKRFPGNMVLPLTEDMNCVYLKEDLSCAIYHHRPEVCRKFGDESHVLMTCPYQDKDGNVRSAKEVNRIKAEVEWNNPMQKKSLRVRLAKILGKRKKFLPITLGIIFLILLALLLRSLIV